MLSAAKPDSHGSARRVGLRSKGLNTDLPSEAQRHGRDRHRRASVVNILDPDVVVIGGGLSQLPHLYEALPRLMRPLIFADAPDVSVRPPRWGDAAGVRGAAWVG